jgi:OOP family OmpA-OmpF porin
MKYFSCLSICLFFYSFTLRSQDTAYIQPAALGVHVFVDGFVQTDKSTATGIALNYLHGFTPRTDFNATLAGSFPSSGFSHRQDGNKHLLLEADASLREKLFPGRRRFNPFLQAGLGVSQYAVYYGAFLPAGLGLQTQLPGETFLLLQGQYRIPLTNTQPGHYYVSLGIAGIIGKKKKQTVRPLPSPPHQANYAKDTDGDGIVDSLDECPLTPGLVSFQGCPDTDGDGIPDQLDKCPQVKGIARLLGCPEPDRDKDGVIDSLDKCPDLPGFRENDGCPVIEQGIRKKIELAAKNVFFETDKYTLLPASFKSLDEVAAILQQNPYLKLDIAGHTDNSGTAEKNQVLSEQRAHAVLEYVIAKPGISKERLSSAGYGSTRPLTTNDTPEGRAMNRRVEFKLRY